MTTIAVGENTKMMLDEVGRKNESYDKLIVRLLELAKKQMFYERQRKILEGEEFISLDKV